MKNYGNLVSGGRGVGGGGESGQKKGAVTKLFCVADGQTTL